MKVIDLLEAPLADIQYINKRTAIDDVESIGSFSDEDVKIIKKYIADNTYKEKLKGLPFNLHVFVVDDLDLKHWGKYYPEDELTPAMIKRGHHSNFGPRYSGEKPKKQILLNKGGMQIAVDLALKSLEKNPNDVAFIMGDNFSDVGQIALTPWIITHRFMHAVVSKKTNSKKLQSACNEVVNMFFDNRIKRIENYLTMKSAKTGKMLREEVKIEILTQVAYTGKLTFDLKDVESSLGLGPTEFVTWKKKLAEKSAKLETAMKELAPKLAGKIFYI
jgi:hypothetical protein